MSDGAISTIQKVDNNEVNGSHLAGLIQKKLIM